MLYPTFFHNCRLEKQIFKIVKKHNCDCLPFCHLGKLLPLGKCPLTKCPKTNNEMSKQKLAKQITIVSKSEK